MKADIQYLLLAIAYFAIFLIAGIFIGKEYGMVVKLPVVGGMLAVSFYFWANFVRR